MSEASSSGDDCYFCMVCEKPFRSPLFSISRQFERMIFYEGGRLPEAEVIAAEGIGTYCSAACLNRARGQVLATENVRMTLPGPGPVETCSRCGGPVDMTKFHLTWSEEEDICEWGEFIDVAQPLNVVVLAVVCQHCAPPPVRLIEAEELKISENNASTLSSSPPGFRGHCCP